MAKQTINIGTSANDGTGSTLRAAFDITNDNFTELYDGSGGLLHKIEGTNFTGSLLVGHSTTGTLSSAQNNTGIGIGALDALTSGDNNVAVGKSAGSSITTGSYNVLLGRSAGISLSTGGENIAIGFAALSLEDGNGKNIAIGTNALEDLNAGADAYNIAIGHDAGRNISTGVQNTIIGGLAGDALATGSENVAIGYLALSAEDGHGANVAVGHSALKVLNAGASGVNAAFGYGAGIAVSTGVRNTLLGSEAAASLTTGSNNTVIGYQAAASAVDVDNEITLGNSSVANVRIPSDSTLKIGASGDLQLEHLSGNSFIKNTAVGDLYIENQVDDGDVIFRCDDSSGGLATYFKLDGANHVVSIAKPFFFQDNVKIYIGNSFDLEIYHDTTNSIINNKTNDLIIQNSADDKDVIFRSDDGSGGLATYFKLDGATSKTIFETSTRHKDNVKANFGDGEDLQIYHTGTGSIIQNLTGNLTITEDQNDGDIIFRCDDGSGGTAEYFRVDGSSLLNIFSKDIRLMDSVRLNMGDQNDLHLRHNGTNALVTNSTGDLFITNEADDKDIIFRSDDGSGGIAEYFRLDGGNASGGVVTTLFPDNSKVVVGNDSDARFWHNGTNSFIQNITGDLEIQNYANDSDIVFQSDDGSGGITEYFRVDGGQEVNVFSKNIKLEDNIKAIFGGGNDLQIAHDGFDSYINNFTGDLNIVNLADDKDIIFKSDDGSGGTETYFFLDGSLSSGNPITVFPDNSKLIFGSDTDLRLFHSGSEAKIENYTGNLTIQQNADDGDIVFESDNGSGGTAEYFRVDGSATNVVFSKDLLVNTTGGYFEVDVSDNSLKHADNTKAKYGTGNDLQIYHDGSNSYINNFAGELNIWQNADDKDIVFASDNGSGGVAEYLRLDGSATQIKIEKETVFADNIKADFGAGADLQIYHNGTNSVIDNITGDLFIRQFTDDGDIRFQSDDGSGGTTEYLRLDGGVEQTVFEKAARFNDNVKGRFGSSGDLEIYHDGTDSFIDDAGTGDLRIRSNFLKIEKYTGETMATFNDDNAVSLYFNNSKKLETTSSGINIQSVPEHADNSAASSAGLAVGDVYRTGDLLKIRH